MAGAWRHPHSWLAFATLYEDRGVEFFAPPEIPEIVPQHDDVEYVVQARDRLDVLARRWYGTTRLDWLLAVANGVDDFTIDLTVGQTLRIPSPRYVFGSFLGR